MRYPLKGGFSTEDRRLDVLPYSDPKSDDYPIRPTLPSVIEVVPKTWTLGHITDQGQEGACVGHGWTSEAMASPDRVHIGPGKYTRIDFPESPNEFAHGQYVWAQKHDGIPGEDYSGTTLLAGAKANQNRGVLREYRWCQSMTDLRDTLITRGPVVIAITWYDSMYSTDSKYVINVGGEIVGGHCLLAYGFHPAVMLPMPTGPARPQPVVRLRNSWGPTYGRNGNGMIRMADLKDLLFPEGVNYGGACIPTLRRP